MSYLSILKFVQCNVWWNNIKHGEYIFNPNLVYKALWILETIMSQTLDPKP
jgi:hypothetical protein